MKLWGLSDLHLGYKANREALETLAPHPDDWLVLAGDIGETLGQLAWCFELLAPRFARLIWVPGNHELWTIGDSPLRGVDKYQACLEICRHFDVVTPEDPFLRWPDDPSLRLVPMFLGYDYTFRPDDVPVEAAREWAREEGLICTDERVLHADPYPSKQAWCAARVRATQARLDAELAPGDRTVLINHYPLLQRLARLPRIPRFTIWCGTRATETWPWRYRAQVVVAGHLHIRTTDWVDGVRFEEVSLGYPRHWRAEAGPTHYLRQLLPQPEPAPAGGSTERPVVHR